MTIKIDLKIFLFAIVFILTHQIKIYALLMILALIHELGHLICGLALGFKPKTIRINSLGFQIEFQVYTEEYKKRIGKGSKLNIKKLLIALAGPATNIFIILISLFIPNHFSVQKQLLVYSNLVIAIFNLLPIYPLDGGRILKELLHIKLGLEKSYEIINKIANVMIIMLTIIASIAILYIHNIAILLIIIYIWYLVIQNNKWYQFKKNIYCRLYQNDIR